MKTIVFAPHPDDEGLGCGGTIAKRIKEGSEVLVIVMTDGRHGFNVLDPEGALPEKVAEIRKNETIEALKKLGVTNPNGNILFLGFEDGRLVDYEREATEIVTQVLQQHLPSEVFVTHSKEWHPDHKTTNRVIKNAINKTSKDIKIYQYGIAYECSTRFGPSIYSFIQWVSHRRVVVDVSKFLSLKREAVGEYRSQTTLFFPAQEQPVLDRKRIERFLTKKEVFYR